LHRHINAAENFLRRAIKRLRVLVVVCANFTWPCAAGHAGLRLSC